MEYLLLAAVLPSLALGVYIYEKDKSEKEPIGLLIALFLGGVAICYPAGSLELVLIDLFETMVPPESVVYKAMENFLGIALVEEALKWLVMFALTKKSKHFNSVFDGIVYAVFTSLGFATLENILYVLENGFEVAVMRAVLSVPAHVFFAIFMGYYYSYYHLKNIAGGYEAGLVKIGGIEASQKMFSGKKDLVLSLFIPVCAHGFFDFCLSVESAGIMLVFFAFVAFMYFFCFKRVGKLSKGDMSDAKMALVMVCAKHPHLREIVQKLQQEKILKAAIACVPPEAVTFEELCKYLTPEEPASAYPVSDNMGYASVSDNAYVPADERAQEVNYSVNAGFDEN